MVPTSTIPRERDLRIDFVRGLALLIIFSDHIVGNPVRDFMPVSLGFSDMAEVFVFLSGCVCGMAYPLPQDRNQFWKITRRLMARALRVYLALVSMLAISWLLITAVGEFSGGKLTAADVGCPPIDTHVGRAFEDIFELAWMPRNYCVLPVYLPFLLAVPLILMLLRWSVAATMAASLAAYLAVQIFPEATSLQQEWPSAQLFNPVAWQLVFVFGIACGKRELRIMRWIPQGVWWTLLAAGGLEAAFVYKMLWPTDLFPMTEKATLGAVRVMHFFCLLLVGRTATRGMFWSSAYLRPVVLCGQHPLAAYCTGGISASAGTLALRTYGIEWPLVAVVNLAGWLAIVAVAFISHHWKHCRKETGDSPLNGRIALQAVVDRAGLEASSPHRA